MSDIESMTILKDASAAAIYGARAAAGVIIVTTKQGEKGKPKLNIDMNYGFSVKDKVYSPLNQAQMADVYNTATDNAGVPRFDVFDPAQNPDARITRTNWMDEIFRTGTTKKVNANISGANDHSTYYVSASYDEN
jgi:TonB-dependent SusC/RagA subfamily outer membrane receptor